MGYPVQASRVNVTRETRQAPPATNADSAVLNMLCVTERGPFTLTDIYSIEEFKSRFGDYTANNLATVAPMEGFFANGGSHAKVARVVHYSTPGDPTTKASAAATFDVPSAASSPTAGSITSSNTAPFVLAHGDTVIVAVDGGGNNTATISATAASRTSTTGTYALSNGQTLVFSIDGGTSRTATFLTANFVDISNATPAEVVAVIQAVIATYNMGGVASVSSNAVKITSNRLGTGSGVNVVSGTANTALQFTTGNTAGTGNVSDVGAVTVAELKTIIEAAAAGCTVTDVSSAVKIASNTTGASSSILVAASSTADDEIGFDNATHTGSTGAAVTTWTFDAEDGDYGNEVYVKVTAASNGDSNYVDVQILRGATVKGTYQNVSSDPTDPRFVETVINGNNTLGLTVTDAGVALLPAVATHGPLAGGDDGLTSLGDNDFIGGVSSNGKTGLRVFDADNDEGTLLICPQRATAALHAAAVTYCTVTRDNRMFFVADMPAGYTAQQAFDYVRTTASLEDSTEVAAIYWPRIKVASPDTSLYGTDLQTVPPSGHIAGLYARSDARKPVGGAFQSPGGIDLKLFGVLGLESTEVNDTTALDKVCSVHINPICKAKSGGFYLNGVLTLSTTGQFQAIGQSRGVIQVQHDMELRLEPLRQKNNTPALRALATSTAEQYLNGLTAQGLLASSIPSEAFAVDFGDGRNPASQQATGRLSGAIGLAVADPAIMVDVAIYRDTRAQDAELAA